MNEQCVQVWDRGLVNRKYILWIAVNLQRYNCKYRKPQSITSVVVVF